MGRNEIISADSLRVLAGQFERAKQEIQNLHRKLGAFRCELDDERGLRGGCLAENHPGRGVVFTMYLGTWNSSTHSWDYDTTTTVYAIDWRYGVPYPSLGATGLFQQMASLAYGTIWECVSLDCESPGACGS